MTTYDTRGNRGRDRRGYPQRQFIQPTASYSPGIEDDNDNLYRTTDIYLSAYLRAIGVDFIRADKLPGPGGRSRLEFIFDRSGVDDFDSVWNDYFRGDAVVNAKAFIDNLKTFKSMCHS